MTYEDFLTNVPKTEIHIHIEATCPPETFMELNKRHGIDGKLTSVDSIKELMKITSLEQMIENFIYLQNFFCSEEDYFLMVDDIAKYAKENNIRYCEAHFSISLPKRKGLDVKKILTLIEERLEQLNADNGIDVRLIIDVSRTFGVENAMDNLRKTILYMSESEYRRIAGIGLGGSEKENDIIDYLPVFEEAQKHGIRCVAHAGEVAGPVNISNAVHKLKAERIGHGISAIEDDGLIAELKQAKIPVEISMTSNILTRHFVSEYQQHPVKKFIQEGLNVCINSDDPYLFDTSITRELNILREDLDVSLSDIIMLLTNSINACFITKEKKNTLQTELMLYYAKYYKSIHV